MSSSMRNFMEAYLAVHNTKAKEKLNSDRDPISEMNLSSLDDSDLEEIAESILQEMFQTGYSVESAQTIFNGMFVESNIVGRQKKIERLNETFNKVFRNIKSKASSIALEEFAKYRNNKKLQESWSARFNQEKRIKRTHNQLIAQESLNVKNLILQLVEKADNSYLEKDMKKRQANNEKARKYMKNMGSMKNPHFGDGPTGSMSSEEVSNIRKGWGDAYTSIYEKRADKDYDGDGDIESGTDEYKGSRDKAIKKAMGKKGKCENCGGKGCEKCEDSIDEATRMAKLGYDDETKLRNRAGGGKSADRATELENKPTYGDDKAAKQRSDLARKQRGDFRKTASSGGSGSRFRSNDPTVMSKQRARAAQRGALTPNERRQLNMGEDKEEYLDEMGKSDQGVRDRIAMFKNSKIEYTPPTNWKQDENRGKGATVSPKQEEKRRRKALRREEYLDETGKSDQAIRDRIAMFKNSKIEYTPPTNWKQDENRGKGATVSPKQEEKRRRKALRREEVTFSEAELEAIQAKVDSWED